MLHSIIDVSGVKKGHNAEQLSHTNAQLRVEDNHGVPTPRKSILVNGATGLAARVAQTIEGKAPDRGVATGKESLANRQRRIAQ